SGSASPVPSGPTGSRWTGSPRATPPRTPRCTPTSWGGGGPRGARGVAGGAVTPPARDHRKDLRLMTIAIIVIVVLVVLLLLYVIATYNGLVRLRNRVENAWAQIDVQLKRRLDLIPNLVE